MFLTCDNRKCGKQFEAQVTREEPHRVICPHCKQEQETVTQFVIRQLVMNKAFITDNKQAFSFFCESCRGVHPGHLKQTADGEAVMCSNCGAKMNVSVFMMRQMRDIIKNADRADP